MWFSCYRVMFILHVVVAVIMFKYNSDDDVICVDVLIVLEILIFL